MYNNTIINAEDGGWCVNIGRDSGGDTVYNNILIPFNDERGSISVDEGSLEADFHSDYNILVDRISIDGGSSLFDFSEWQAYGYDTHSKLADSMHHIFIDWENGDYHLLPTSQAVDSGTSIVSVVVIDDLDGVTRLIGEGYDIGAYEYNPSGINIPDETNRNPCKIVIKENYVIFNNLNPNETIEIFDVKGSLIHKSGNIARSIYRYNIENLKSGVYFWHINNNQGNKVKGKIVIAK